MKKSHQLKSCGQNKIFSMCVQNLKWMAPSLGWWKNSDFFGWLLRYIYALGGHEHCSVELYSEICFDSFLGHICLRFFWDMTENHRRFNLDMPDMGLRYAKDLPEIEICLRYSRDMPDICHQYICLIYIPNIYILYTCDTWIYIRFFLELPEIWKIHM